MPAGRTCTVTSRGSEAISSAKRYRRAISKATRPTSQGRLGTSRGRSMRPTCRTETTRAPSATARPTGMLCTSPPSRKCSSPTRTGGSRPGTAAEASTAGTTGPAVNQRAAERLGSGAVAPQPEQPRHRLGRVGRDEHAVDRAHRGPDDQVRPDPGLGERLEHPDLVRAQHPAAAEHERGAPVVPRPVVPRPVVPRPLDHRLLLAPPDDSITGGLAQRAERSGARRARPGRSWARRRKSGSDSTLEWPQLRLSHYRWGGSALPRWNVQVQREPISSRTFRQPLSSVAVGYIQRCSNFAKVRSAEPLLLKHLGGGIGGPAYGTGLVPGPAHLPDRDGGGVAGDSAGEPRGGLSSAPRGPRGRGLRRPGRHLGVHDPGRSLRPGQDRAAPDGGRFGCSSPFPVVRAGSRSAGTG